ncbi:carbohydrate binding domain-containing protein, partial [Myxococcota bacterium]|nr:carbohydrate binding domain-containing protein [Myxococcota bacterium]
DTTDCTVTITGCTPDATQVGTTVCGLNDEGFIVQLCSALGVWEDTWECSGTDVCVNGAQQEGTTVCHTTGVLYQDCTGGQWVDSANCTVGGCMEDATQVGTTVCGLNDEGFFIELCDNAGAWNDTAQCTGTDICINGAADSTTCAGGLGTQDLLCSGGTWVNDGLCQCASGYHYTGTTCAQDITVTWCDIVSPMDYDGLAGTPETIYAQIYGTIGGSQVTNSGAELESIDARVCYDDGGVEVCTDATYNPSCLSCGNNDEYMAPLTFDASGTYGYYYKFSGDMGATWTTCSTTFTASITGSGSGGAEPPNGDFEDWTAGSPDSWTDMDTGITVAQETTTVHAGSSAAAVTVNTSTQADTDFTQTIPVVSGTTYDVSVWIYHPVGTHVRVAISHSSSFGTFSDPAVQGSWQLVTSSFTAAAATALVGVRFYDITGFAAGELVYIDDFSVTPQ